MLKWGHITRWTALIAVLSPAVADAAEPSTSGSSRGATIPWVTYEAETAATNGRVLGPDFTGDTAAREASGRSCVLLNQTGQYIDFKATADAQGLIVRYSIPDSADGRGQQATLSWSINGKSQSKLQLTSALSYLYGKYPFANDPAAGSPRNFWNEIRLLLPSPIHAGDTLRIEKKSDDSANEYRIDLIDLEAVPPALTRPADAVSVADLGATADGSRDDRGAFVAAIAQAKETKKSVWIPAGRYVIGGAIEVNNIAIRGAGMWYTTLAAMSDGLYPSARRVAIYGNGSNVALSDFAITGNLNYRNDEEPNDGVGGTFGSGSSIRNLWIEHTKTGAWLVNSDGLLVEGCRFRNCIADGINLCLGMRNCTIRNCTARGTGDDCFAMWPATYAPATAEHGGNRFIHCTAQLPFLAQGFSIYGGEGNRVEQCVATDIPYGAGIYASTTFPTVSGFHGTTMFRDIAITRAGDNDGAIGTVANLLDLPGLRFEKIDVIDSPIDGMKFTSMNGHALRDAIIDRVRIINAGLAGHGSAIAAASGAVGKATLSNTSIEKTESVWQANESTFELVRGEGNVGFADSIGKGGDQKSAAVADR